MENVNLNLKSTNAELKVQNKKEIISNPKVKMEAPEDSFELSKEEKMIVEIDPNDIYQVDNTSMPKNLASTKLGASITPQKIIKWGGRLWAVAEFYDTLDAYYERFKKMLDKKEKDLNN